MRRCLFGGSFDPVHCGHLMIAGNAVRTLGLDELVFLPCAQSPLKEKAAFFSDQERLDRLHDFVKDVPWARISRMDLDLTRPSWSWRLVELWKELHPDDELFWLMGVDQWEELEKWGRWEYFCSMLTCVVHHRGKVPKEREGVKAVFIEGFHPASSSEIRRCMAQGLPIPEGWV